MMKIYQTGSVSKIEIQEERIIKEVYKKYKEQGVYWLMQKYGIHKDEALDVFQNAVVILYDKIAHQRLDIPRHKLKAYLFGLLKNKGLEYLRSLKKFITSDYLEKGGSKENKIQFENQLQEVCSCMELLSESARKILTLYYFNKKSIQEITSILGYKNTDTTKNMKYKSLQKLKKLVLASNKVSNRYCIPIKNKFMTQGTFEIEMLQSSSY